MKAVNTAALPSLLNEYEVAKMLGLSVASIRRYRLLKLGPKFVKLGACVRYKPEDITAWVESRPSGGEQVQSKANA